LAQAILERLEPAVRLAAARATSGSEGKCQQVWCPVCALAAVVAGEQHPLLSVIAEHSVALLAVVRAMADAMDPGQGDATGGMEPPTDPTGPGPDDDPPPSGPGRYQHIPVTVEE
jgi:phosphoribosylamine-glycine ligase